MLRGKKLKRWVFPRDRVLEDGLNILDKLRAEGKGESWDYIIAYAKFMKRLEEDGATSD